MKILLISDTHGSIRGLDKILEGERFDALLHMGDAQGQEDLIRAIASPVPVDFVAGNCDFFSKESRELVLNYRGVSVFMTHGDRYGVKSGLTRLKEAAKKAGAEVAIYGHTHVPDVSFDGSVWTVNPGSFSRPGQRSRVRTYAVMTAENGRASFELREVP